MEQANPEVVYVPEYNPTAVYGAPAYPYPSIDYPAVLPRSGARRERDFLGRRCRDGRRVGWRLGLGRRLGHNDIDMNINNNFNRNSNFNRNNINRTGRNTWQHNPQHRGGAPYANRATANRFGSNARGDSLASRQKGRPAADRPAKRQSWKREQSCGCCGSRNRAGVGNRAGHRQPCGRLSTVRGAGSAGAGSAASGNLGGADRVGNRSVGSGSSRGIAAASAAAREVTVARCALEQQPRRFQHERCSARRRRPQRWRRRRWWPGGGGGRGRGGGRRYESMKLQSDAINGLQNPYAILLSCCAGLR